MYLNFTFPYQIIMILAYLEKIFTRTLVEAKILNTLRIQFCRLLKLLTAEIFEIGPAQAIFCFMTIAPSRIVCIKRDQHN